MMLTEAIYKEDDNENGFVYVGEYRNGLIFTVGDYIPDWINELKSCLNSGI